MEKAYLKALALQNATDKFVNKVTAMQSAINQQASVEEVSRHYSSIVFEAQIVGQLLADVRRCCFECAVQYHTAWDI